jgi:hypothetical protein
MPEPYVAHARKGASAARLVGSQEVGQCHLYIRSYVGAAIDWPDSIPSGLARTLNLGTFNLQR